MNKLIELIEKGKPFFEKKFLETNICERFGMALLQGCLLSFSHLFSS